METVMTSRPLLPLLLGGVLLLLTSPSAHGWRSNGTLSDSGHLDNCAEVKHGFKFEWSPKTVVIGNKLTVSANIEPGADLENGEAKITVLFGGGTLFDKTQAFSCTDLSQFVPVTCPLRKGVAIKYDRTLTVPQVMPIPPGRYGVTMRVSNDKKQEVLCVKGSVDVRIGG